MMGKDLLFTVTVIVILFCWTVWPEDIVGTRELALLLALMLWQNGVNEK